MNDNERKIKALAKKMGAENANKFLNALGRSREFIDAIESEVGQQLMKGAVQEVINCVAEIIDMRDLPDCSNCKVLCKMNQLRAAKNILDRWSREISNHKELLNKWQNV